MKETPNIVELLRGRSAEIASLATKLFFDEYPELELKYGDSGRSRCTEDTLYHINYLIEAVSVQSKSLFCGYLEWAYLMLSSRNLPVDDLTKNIGCIKAAIQVLFESVDHSMIIEYLEEGSSHLNIVEPDQKTFITPDNPLASEARQYLDYLLGGHRFAAVELIDSLVENGVSVADIYEHIFQSTQYEIGALWQMNKITVAHEHYCTATTQLIMSRLYPIIFSNKKNGLRLVACSAANELHEIGIRMVSDFFEMNGWDTYYMGANMPTSHLLTTLMEYKADVLAISVTLPIHINVVRRLINEVRSEPRLKGLKILVGGYPFIQDSELWRKLGADGTALSAKDAVNTANNLVNAA